MKFSLLHTSGRSLRSTFVSAAFAALVLAGSASAVTINTTGTTSGGAVSGNATITTGLGSVTVTLNNTTPYSSVNQVDPANLLSGITFTLGGSTATGTLSAVKSINGWSNINANGTYAAQSPSGFDLTRWVATGNSGTITMTTLSGGNPDRLIIGPDSLGGFSGSGVYNLNAGAVGDNPTILGSLTFTISGLSGVTVNSAISNVVFQWGTATGGNTTGNNTPPPSVPDGGTTALLLGGALAALGLVRRKV